MHAQARRGVDLDHAAAGLPHRTGDVRREQIDSRDVQAERQGGAAGDRRFVGRVAIDGEERSISGRGNGLISGVMKDLGVPRPNQQN